MRRLGVDKRTVSVSVKMSERDLKKLLTAAERRWPKAILSRSSIVLGLSLIGADAVLEENRKR